MDLGCHIEQDVDKNNSDKSVNKKEEDCQNFSNCFMYGHDMTASCVRLWRTLRHQKFFVSTTIILF